VEPLAVAGFRFVVQQCPGSRAPSTLGEMGYAVPGLTRTSPLPLLSLHAACNTFLGTRDQADALAIIREHVLVRGVAGQHELLQSAVWHRLEALFSNWRACLLVTESAARLLSAVVARNSQIAYACKCSVMFPALHDIVVASGKDAVVVVIGETEPVSAPESGQVDLLGAATGAMWAVCSCVMANNVVAQAVQEDVEFLKAIVAHLDSGFAEAVAASSWLLCNLCTSQPATRGKLAAIPDFMPKLFKLLRDPTTPEQSLMTLWVVQAFICDQSTAMTAMVTAGVLPILIAFMEGPNITVIAAAAWCCGTLGTGGSALQQALLDSGALSILLKLVQHPASQVRDQVLTSMYNIAAKYPPAQSYLGDHGALELLAALLPTESGSVCTVERVLSTLLCVILKHAGNQLRLAAVRGLVPVLIGLLTCSSTRIRGLAAGTMRTLLSEQPSIQTAFTTHGCLPPLLNLCAGPDTFVSEQAVAALYNCIALHSHNKTLLMSLNPQVQLIQLLSDCTKPSRLAYLCGVMVSEPPVCFPLCSVGS